MGLSPTAKEEYIKQKNALKLIESIRDIYRDEERKKVFFFRMDTRRSQRIKSLRNKNANLWLLLPEDLIFRIFTFVPPHRLINSVRYVCKLWAAAIASSGFAQACQRFHVRSKPGLYVHNRKSERSSYFLEFKDDVNAQVERTHLETPSKMGRVISTCDGILLLLSEAKQLFVANPILKCWRTIPYFPVSRQLRHVCHHCTIACVPHTDKFKVFYVDVLEVSGISWYVFYVLRVGIDNSWKEIARKQAPHRSYALSKPVCNGGNALYWITNREVIVMDVDKEIIVREYPLPPRDKVKYLWMGDFLSCIVYGNSIMTYEIYMLDLDSGIWTLYHEMRLRPIDYISASGHNHNPRNPITWSLRLGINNRIIIQVGLHQRRSHKNIHFGYNVKTGQLTKIEDIDMEDFEAWPHTNSLVSLPSTPA